MKKKMTRKQKYFISVIAIFFGLLLLAFILYNGGVIEEKDYHWCIQILTTIAICGFASSIMEHFFSKD